MAHWRPRVSRRSLGGQGLILGCVRENGSREMEIESNSFEKSALQREEEIWGGALAGGVESRKC